MLPRCLVLVASLAACGGDDAPTSPDAVIGDAPLDGADECDPATLYFAGELLGWDATAAMPSGLGDIAVSQRGDPTKQATTMPDGAFALCISNDPQVLLDVAPAIGSPIVGGVAIVDKDVIAAGGAYSVRTFERARAVQDYAFDDTKAHVYVRVNGAPRTVSVAATTERSYSFDGGEWRPGEDTGQDVYLANVDPGEGETKLQLERALGVPTTIPLAAGAFTFVVVNAEN